MSMPAFAALVVESDILISDGDLMIQMNYIKWIGVRPEESCSEIVEKVEMERRGKMGWKWGEL